MSSGCFRALCLSGLLLVADASLLASAATAKNPPYLLRGDEVEKEYHAYTKRLKRDFLKIRAALKKQAPELLKKLSPEPPKPVEYGYQLVPKIIPDVPAAPGEPAKITSTSYTWGRTRFILQLEYPKIDSLEKKMSATPPRYEEVIEAYQELERGQKLVDDHLQYNRFWQKAVAEDKARYDKLTAGHDAVLEKQDVLDALKVTPNDPALKKRAAELTKKIDDETLGQMTPAPFITLESTTPNHRVLRVKLATDITDAAFIARVKTLLEQRWHVQDGKDLFEMKVDLRAISPAKLYKNTAPPAKGTHLDLVKHVTFFPANTGLLTTGSNNTYAIPRHYVAFGPQDITENTVAHEFGHILGFVDGYFRGYRDRGVEGYEILEVIPDREDIMCTPGLGKVQRKHFEAIIERMKSKPASLGKPASG